MLTQNYFHMTAFGKWSIVKTSWYKLLFLEIVKRLKTVLYTICKSEFLQRFQFILSMYLFDNCEFFVVDLHLSSETLDSIPRYLFTKFAHAHLFALKILVIVHHQFTDVAIVSYFFSWYTVGCDDTPR